MPAPQVPSSCTAWVNVIGMACHGWAQAEEDSGERQLAERAGWKVASAIRRGMGCEGWSAWPAFVREALSVLTSLASMELAAELRELASIVQASLKDEVSAAQQADEILAKAQALAEQAEENPWLTTDLEQLIASEVSAFLKDLSAGS